MRVLDLKMMFLVLKPRIDSELGTWLQATKRKTLSSQLACIFGPVKLADQLGFINQWINVLVVIAA